MEQVYLSRTNLVALLSKLDRKKSGEETACTIIKYDNKHPKYSQTVDAISITAIEDEDYYIDREPGMVHPSDVRKDK